MMEPSSTLEYKEQAMGCLTNILLENECLASAIFEKIPNLVGLILEIIESQPRLPRQVLRTIIECFESVAKLSSPDQMLNISSVLMVAIRHETYPGDTIRITTMRLFKELSNTQNEQFLSLITVGNTIEVLMDAWTKSESSGSDPALEGFYLRTLANIASSSNDDIQTKLVSRNIVSVFGKYVTNDYKGFQIEALWGLSNVACHSRHTAGAIINDDVVLNKIVTKLTSPDLQVKKEAYFVIGNLLTTVSQKDLQLTLRMYPGLVGQYCTGLETLKNNQEVLVHILESIEILARNDFGKSHQPGTSDVSVLTTLQENDLDEKLSELEHFYHENLIVFPVISRVQNVLTPEEDFSSAVQVSPESQMEADSAS